MAAALLKIAAANPKLTQAVTAQATAALKNPTGGIMDKVRENFSSIAPSRPSSPGTTSTTYQTFRTLNVGLCRVIEFIWDKLKIIFRFMFLTRSPAAYVVWLLIIIAIILGVAFGVHFGRKRSTLARNKNVDDKNFKNKLKSSILSENPTNDGYRKNALQQSVSGEPNKVDGYKRNLLTGGRCDGLNWITDPVSKKECLKNLPPPTIRWEFNSDEYKDIGDLPESYLEENRDKQSINIPYRLIGDRFYADCANMSYADGTNAKLFIQKNIKDNMCQYIEKSATPYRDEERLAKHTNLYTICEN